MATVSETLNAAADLFERPGWPTWRAGWAGTEHFSTYHTICMAARESSPTIWRPAIRGFAEAVGFQGKSLDDAINWLDEWDQADGRDQDAVVASLRLAALSKPNAPGAR